MNAHAALLTAGLALALSAAALAEPIATDRPDFVESADVVGKGRVQVETSVAWERDRQDGLRSRLRGTPTLLRLGVSDDWELRLETDGALRARLQAAGQTARARGWADVSLGAKWHVRDGDEDRGTPGMAWLVHLDVPSGSSAFRANGSQPSLRLVAEWELPGGLSIGVMPGFYVARGDAGGRDAGGILAAVVGKSFTERLRGFVELSGQQLAAARHGGSVITADAGLAWLLGEDLQLDSAVSRGLNRHSPDWGWTVGLSARF